MTITAKTHRRTMLRFGVPADEKRAASINDCFRPSLGASKADLKEFHGEDLKLRRAAQSARLPGFLVVPNKRVDGAISVAALSILAANPKLGPAEVHHQAVREVARNLPAPRMMFDWHQTRGSKSDDPAYRNREFRR
jgi:hypothetical protein